MGSMDGLPKWKRTLPSVDHSLFNDPANIAIEFYKEHLLRDVDSRQLQPADVWIALRGFLVAAAQTYAAVCILLAKNRLKPLMLQAEVLNRSLFEIFATVLALTEEPLGYLPVNQTGAVLFFQLMSRRYERASTVLTSNKSFEEWGEIMGDDVMAAALIDRILHHWPRHQHPRQQLPHARALRAVAGAPSGGPWTSLARRLTLARNPRRCRRLRVRHPIVGCAIFTRHECAVFGRR